MSNEFAGYLPNKKYVLHVGDLVHITSGDVQYNGTHIVEEGDGNEIYFTNESGKGDFSFGRSVDWLDSQHVFISVTKYNARNRLFWCSYEGYVWRDAITGGAKQILEFDPHTPFEVDLESPALDYILGEWVVTVHQGAIGGTLPLRFLTPIMGEDAARYQR